MGGYRAENIPAHGPGACPADQELPGAQAHGCTLRIWGFWVGPWQGLPSKSSLQGEVCKADGPQGVAGGGANLYMSWHS